MKKFFLLAIFSAIVGIASAQSISMTVNSIDFKYQGLDAATWCPPGSVISANVLSRTITVEKDGVKTFTATLKSFAKIDNHYSFTGVASDKNIKDAKVYVDVYTSGKIKLKVVLQNGKVYRRSFSI